MYVIVNVIVLLTLYFPAHMTERDGFAFDEEANLPELFPLEANSKFNVWSQGLAIIPNFHCATNGVTIFNKVQKASDGGGIAIGVGEGGWMEEMNGNYMVGSLD